MVSACLEINAPRDIARQILRHRSFSFQEFSQRYANPLDSLKWIRREARMQDPKNRQNSIDLDLKTEYDRNLNDEWLIQQDSVAMAATKAYKWAIDNGIAKEQARAVLPEGLMMSRMYVNGTIRSWIHYIDLRSDNGTQKEHILIAKACAKAISDIFPLITKYGE
jgi:thymidylate synthase (FAD)